MDKSLTYLVSILSLILVVGHFVIFVIRCARYKYVGNRYLYALVALIACLALALVSNFSSFEVFDKYDVSGTVYTVKNVTGESILSKIGSSVFEAIKMMGFGFEKTKLSAYMANWNQSEHFHETLFGVAYFVSSLFGIIFTSIIVVLTIFRNFRIKFKTFRQSFNTSKEVYYLFSDSNVTITAKLAEELQMNGHIVVIYLSRASQLTQAGTEFKDNLISKGFDVRVETYGDGLMKYLFGKTFNKYFCPLFRLFRYRNRKVRVYGLFSNDETSIELANSFKKAVINNRHFCKIRRKVFYSVKINDYVDDTISDLQKDEFKAYLSGEEVNKKTKRESQELLAKISNAIGLKTITNQSNRNIRRFIKRNKLGDTDFLYLLHHFLRKNMSIDEIIGYSNKKLDAWVKLIKGLKKKSITPGELQIIKNYRVFLTYHESDLDIISHYSDSTLHIVNTLSQYDIISSEFVLANQLTNFIKIPSDGKDIPKNDYMHVTFFGFGKINQPIFKKMTSAFQLWNDDKNKVHYHIVDKESVLRRESMLNRYSGGPVTPIDYSASTILTEKEDAGKVTPPFLYDISADCDGKDLNDYNTIDTYVKSIFSESNRFNRSGFEIFVISVRNTTSDIKIARELRKAILEHKNDKENKEKCISKTVIFVRVANRQSADSLFSNNAFVKSQEDINNGLLFKGKRSQDTMVPIIMFGENALMSTYISEHLETITKYAIEALRSYQDKEFDEAEKEWLLLDKREVLSNVATIYSLKTKLALLGYKLNKKYEVIPDTNKKSFKEFINSCNAFKEPKNYAGYEPNMKKLAALEHNRWVAEVSHIYNYGQMSIDDFANPWKYNFATKTKDYTLHVCMLSNLGLRIMRERLLEKYKGDEKKEDKIWNITLVYDIRAMQKIFDSLKNKEAEEIEEIEEEEEEPKAFRNDPIV